MLKRRPFGEDYLPPVCQCFKFQPESGILTASGDAPESLGFIDPFNGQDDLFLFDIL